MKNIYIYKLILILFPFIFFSCEDIIDVELNSVEPHIVIEGNVRMDSLATVRVTTTKDFSSVNEYTPIRDAVVKITDNAGNEETLTINANGDYVAQNIRGVINRTYSLSVTHEGIEYTAESRMPPVVNIDSLTLFDFPFLDYPTPMIHFTDPKGDINQFYRFVVFVNGVRPYNWFELFSSEMIDGFPIHQRLSVPYGNNDTEDPVHQGDTLSVEMQCIDEDVFTFWSTLDMIDNSLANPTSNIKGGALGYFSAYSHQLASIEAIW